MWQNIAMRLNVNRAVEKQIAHKLMNVLIFWVEDFGN